MNSVYNWDIMREFSVLVSLYNVLCSGVEPSKPVRGLFVSYDFFGFFLSTLNKMKLLILDTVCARQ